MPCHTQGSALGYEPAKPVPAQASTRLPAGLSVPSLCRRIPLVLSRIVSLVHSRSVSYLGQLMFVHVFLGKATQQARALALGERVPGVPLVPKSALKWAECSGHLFVASVSVTRSI